MNQLILVLAMFLMGGCGASKEYKSVQAGPRASVTFSKVTNWRGVPESKASPQMLVGVFEPDADCSLDEKSRFWIENDERIRTVFMPAGRVYLGMAIIGFGYLSQRASFLLEDGREYIIQFKLLPSEEVGSTKFSYNYYRSDGSDRNLVPIDVDHFSVCTREKQVPKG